MMNTEWYEKAKSWYIEHREHVDKLVASTNTKFPPSLEDTPHPELWKAGSWNWFLEGEKF